MYIIEGGGSMTLTVGKGDNDLGIEIECVVVFEPVDDVDNLRLCTEPTGGFIAVDDSGVDGILVGGDMHICSLFCKFSDVNLWTVDAWDGGTIVPMDEETLDTCVATCVYNIGSLVGVDPFADGNCEFELVLVPVLVVDIAAGGVGVGSEEADDRWLYNGALVDVNAVGMVDNLVVGNSALVIL